MGKCGTTSLAHLLDSQPDSCFSHEMQGTHWFEIFSDYQRVKKNLLKRAESNCFVGDVSYAWAQYTNRIIEDFPDVKFINLWRDKEETVESFWKGNQNRVEAINTPTPWATREFWLVMYPFFGFPPSKDQIAHTYDIYHRLTEIILTIYPKRVFCLNVKSLNDIDKVDNLLNFVGIPKEQRVLEKVQANKKGRSSMELFVIPNEEMTQKYKHSMKANITLEASQRRRSL